MGQKGFFDVERRLEAISAKGDALETIKKMVRWEDFRSDIEAVTETKPEERKSNAGRKPYDTNSISRRVRQYDHAVQPGRQPLPRPPTAEFWSGCFRTVERLNYRNSMGQWCRCATAEHPFMPVRTSFHAFVSGCNTHRIVARHGANGATARRRLGAFSA
jgi:hypothetical protein